MSVQIVLYKEADGTCPVVDFFHGQTAAILAHAITKEDVVPPADFKRAKQRKTNFYADPTTHTYLGGFHA